MGIVKRKQTDIVGEIRTIDPKPIWVGTSDRTPHIKRYMGTEEAEEWVKGEPDRRVIMKCKKFELEEY